MIFARIGCSTQRNHLLVLVVVVVATVVAAVVEVVLHLVGDVVLELVLQVACPLGERQPAQQPRRRAHCQPRPHPHLAALRRSGGGWWSTTVRRRWRRSSAVRISTIRRRSSSSGSVGATTVTSSGGRVSCRRRGVRRRLAVGWGGVVGVARLLAVRRRRVRIGIVVSRGLSDGDADVEAPLRPTGGALEREGAGDLAPSDAGVVEDVAEREARGPDERLGDPLVAGVGGVDDVDVEDGVVEAGGGTGTASFSSQTGSSPLSRSTRVEHLGPSSTHTTAYGFRSPLRQFTFFRLLAEPTVTSTSYRDPMDGSMGASSSAAA
ncbi:unnamed protein product [Urochloa humidicola]